MFGVKTQIKKNPRKLHLFTWIFIIGNASILTIYYTQNVSVPGRCCASLC